MAKKGPRKKVPKELAIINADNCTGCESCLEVCPVDCIFMNRIDRGVLKGTQQWCEILSRVPVVDLKIPKFLHQFLFCLVERITF